MTTPTPKDLSPQTIAQIILAYHGLNWTRADDMINHPEGRALLALLCNAAAKEAPVMYEFKSKLIRMAIRMAGDWWATPHSYGDDYEADTLVYIENRVGRFSFHVKASDPQLSDLLAHAPQSDRGWSGVSMQAQAKQLAQEWMDAPACWVRAAGVHISAERLPFDQHDQQ